MGHVVVVRGDAIDHDRVFAVLRGHFDAQLHVGAVVLVREHFADVVQQPAPLGEVRVELELRGHHSGEPGHFLRMVEDVLPVGRAVLHPPHQLDHLRVHPLDARVVDRPLPRLGDRRRDFVACFLHHFLDAARVDAPVGDQALQRQPPDFPPYRVEAGDHDGVGGVVDDDVHAGRRLERADVAALAADDPALHLIRWQHHG